MTVATQTSTVARLKAAHIGAFFRLRDARAAGVTFYELQRCLADSLVERVSRGLYRLTEFEIDETETIASVATAAPDAIVCLLTALRYHDLGTQNPREIWIALDRRRRQPVRFPARVRVLRFSGPMLTQGVETVRMLGAAVRITSPARTVVDCFRYRNKVGIDVAVEALKDFSRRRRGSATELARLARIGRVARVMQPYLDSIA